MELTPQRLLSFNGYKVLKINSHLNENLIELLKEDLIVDLETSPIWGEEGSKDFKIIFNLRITSQESPPILKMEIETLTYFSSSEPITKDFKESSFITLNAPAIVFPYIRSLVSNITSSSGFNPIVLPVFNFSAAVKENPKQ